MTLTVLTRTLNGAFKKYALVYTNDPKMHRFKLTIRGEVIPLVRIDPAGAVNFYGVAGATLVKTLTLCPGQKRPLEIKNVANSIPNMVAHELSALKDGCYRLTLKNRLMEPGSYSGRIDIHTGYPEKEVIEVNVRSLLIPKVQVYPSRLIMGRLSRNGPKESRWLTVSSNIGGAITIKDISCNKELFNIEVDESDSEKGRLRLTVVLNLASLPPGRFQEPLILSFEERDLDPVKVTVTGLVEE